MSLCFYNESKYFGPHFDQDASDIGVERGVSDGAAQVGVKANDSNQFFAFEQLDNL